MIRSIPRHTRTAPYTLTAFVLLLAAIAACGGDEGGAAHDAAAHDTASNDADAMAGMDMDSPGAEATAMPGMEMGGELQLTAAEISTFGITFGEAARRPLERSLRAVGLVAYDETRLSRVAPRFGGWVETLHVDATGDAVRKGDPLLEAYAPELVAAQTDLLLASRMLDSVGTSRLPEVAASARELLESARQRLAWWEISDAQIDEILATGKVRRTLTLHAPASGVVLEKEVVEGMAFQPGQSLYLIADLSQIWVNAEVFEIDVPFVREGMPAEVSVAALPGVLTPGRVDFVHPTLNERTRALRLRVVVRNPGTRFKPGMYATVHLRASLGERLTLPTSAVLQTGDRAVAFVAGAGGALEPRELRLGVRGGELVEVLDGVEAGERVVTSAHFLLDSESNLAEVMRAMMAQMGISDMGEMEGMDMSGTTPPDSSGGR
ncbi:MAG: efflux RND transporter periplasmic adaptor subunit [Longimicrobiales bacterium]|nr:efflux RND transporter periplasmic adaptor subunit [Longimicrobiales bacterium]